jgi:hypothetical protein
MILALLVVVAEGLVKIPPAHWTAVHVPVREDGAIVSCSFDVRTEGLKVQALLIERSQAGRFQRGRSTSSLYSTGLESSARFRYRVQQAGNYILMLDNRLEPRRAADVVLRVELVSPHNMQVREASPELRRTVVVLSLLFFGSVLVFSARQFFKHAPR